MIRNVLLTTLRTLSHHKVPTGVNIISLALGLAVFAFAFLYVKQQLSYNSGWDDAERIHRLVVEQRGLPGVSNGESISIDGRNWPLVADYFASEAEAATRVHVLGVRIRESSPPGAALLHFVDPAFRKIFPLDLIAGDLERALSGPGFIALEETLAAALGLNIKPGSRITLAGNQDDELEFEVAAIYRLQPDRSPALNFQMLTLIHDSALPLFGTQQQLVGWQYSTRIWLKLKPGIETDAFNAQQPAFVQAAVTAFNEALGPDRHISDHVFFRWQPLRELHFNPVGFAESSSSGDLARVATFALVGFLVLLVGCTNSVSLSLASAIERRKEVGIRKAVGALPRDIVVHAVGQSLLLALTALIPAILLLELLLPTFQTLMPYTVALEIGWAEIGLLALIALVVGLGSGVYPALVLSDVRPQAVLKSGASAGAKAGQRIRALLVGVQFCCASMLLTITAALYLQLAVTRAQPLGFNPENTVFIWFANIMEGLGAESLNQELGKIPGVVQVALAMNPPDANMPLTSNTASLINKSGSNEEIEAHIIYGSHELLDLVQIPLLAGRGYDATRDRVAPQTPQGEGPPPAVNLIVNRSTAHALGFTSPEAAVGREITQHYSDRGQLAERPSRIIGVVEDNMYGSLRRRPGPEIYPLMPADIITLVMLKYQASAESTLQQKINDVAQRVTGAPAAEIIFIEPLIEGAFRQEQNESKLLMISGALALLLACIGLYGLAAFLMERGIKEVGVRKVLGAGMGSIVTLFLWRFTLPVLAANLIAWPVAVYFILQWVEQFPYQIDKGWLLALCLGTAAVVLLIAVMTVSMITARAAGRQPVRSLRYE